MARVYGIKKRLEEENIDAKVIKAIVGDGDLVHMIERMEEYLDPGLAQSILESCGCTGGRDHLKKCEKTGENLAGQSLDAKIRHLNEQVFTAEKIVLNDDCSLTAFLEYRDGEKYRCACSAAVKKGMHVSDLAFNGGEMPLSYCYCCAGAFRNHLQLQLGVPLKTREILSSPINSGGNKPCAFTFELLET